MDVNLLKKLGNITQLAGIRQTRMERGRGAGMALLEFYNAAGLRFTVTPDRCMDIFDLSYKGVNLSFQSKNGLVAGQAFDGAPQEFADQWPGGMLFTCGLDNVGGGYEDGARYPTHGRVASLPAAHLAATAGWEAGDYVLRAQGDVHQTRLYGRHLCLHRSIETTLNARAVRLRDRLTNCESADEPFMLLYHFNFGYPLLDEGCLVYTSATEVLPRNDLSTDPAHITAPVDGRPEELYFHRAQTGRAWCALVNPALGLGAYIAFDTDTLPYFSEWKNMRSHDYVLGIEPCNCKGLGRREELADGSIPVIGGYESLEYSLELGVLDGQAEIDAFLAGQGTTILPQDR